MIFEGHFQLNYSNANSEYRNDTLLFCGKKLSDLTSGFLLAVQNKHTPT